MRKTKKAYEEYLNELYDIDTCKEQTEHCWAGNDKSESQKASALELANRGMYGTCIRVFDPIAFQVGFNEWTL